MKKIFLIGYMGCGKSSLGRKLAKVANMEFMDMDAIIEQREGASISDIFYYQGEEYFRNAERALIEELVRPRVIWLSLRVAELLRGRIIWSV